MRLDPLRSIRAIALLLWAGFFVYLWISGEAVNYVGRRTAWVVPFGAITLSSIALIYLPTARTADHRPSRPSIVDLTGALLVLAPLLVLFMIPSPSLGALATKRKGSTDSRNVPAPDTDREDPLSVSDVSWATGNPEFRELRGIRDGTPVDLKGIVTRNGHRELQVTRFYAACCAADAIPYSVRVRAGNARALSIEQWVRVRGRIKLEGEKVFVVAPEATPIDEPDDPYIE